MPSPSFSSSQVPSPAPPKPSKSALRSHLKSSLLPLIPEEDITAQSRRAQETISHRLEAWQRAERVSIYLSMPSGEARTEGLVRKAFEEGKSVFVPVLCRQHEEVVGEGEGKPVAVGRGEGADGAPVSGGGGSGAGAGSAGDGDGVGTGMLEPKKKKKKKKKKRKMRMEMLKLDSLEEFELLERDSWGIPSLPPTSLAGRENARGGFGPEGRPSRPGEEEREEGRARNDGKVVEGKDGGLDLIVVPGVAFDRDMARMGHGAGFYDGYLTRLVTEGRHEKPFLVGLCLAEQVLEPGRILMEEWDWRVDAVATGGGRLLTAEGGA
ncbi:hypothetical protein D0862_14567 [Hortaea werneckii]|uniref:5-formyltetrahydrofolate cyclo-ligase n=1 Tax=Hortaea werneckii TaxID=91943 RepID=A0A3M7E4Y3_HORWE|nr:hypothetical protein D0862_14567 [Hortaea werneckii]